MHFSVLIALQQLYLFCFREQFQRKVKSEDRREAKRNDNFRGKSCRFFLERTTGIEPASKAWEAFILPMNYVRTEVIVSHFFRNVYTISIFEKNIYIENLFVMPYGVTAAFPVICRRNSHMLMKYL